MNKLLLSNEAISIVVRDFFKIYHILVSSLFVSSLFDSQVIHKYNNMSAVTTINILQFYAGVNDSNIVERKK